MLGVHVLAWWLRPEAFFSDIDSQHYGRLAAQMLNGTFAFEPHTFNDRFGVTVPVAAIYRVLGIGVRTSTLWPLIASLVTIAIVFVATDRTFGRRAALLAALLLATNVVQIDYAAHLIPDIILAVFMVGSAALLYAARDPERGASARPALHGSLCALLLFAGLLTKKTVLWGVPFFVGLMVWDLVRQRRNVRLWTAFLATGVACTVSFLLFYFLATGDPLYPLANVEGAHNELRTSFFGKSRAQYVERLTESPIKFFIRQAGYGHLMLLAVPALLCLVRPLRALPRGARYWAAYLAIVLGSFWFGTTSLRSYNLLPVSPRFLIPLLAPLSILGGVTLARALPDGGGARGARSLQLILAALFLVTGSVAVNFDITTPARCALYLCVGLVFALLASPVRSAVGERVARYGGHAIVAVLSLGILVHHGMGSAVKVANPLRVLEEEFVRDHVAQLPAGAVVLTDEHSVFLVPLLLERCDSNGASVFEWNDAAAIREHAGAPAFVFVNQVTLSLLLDWVDRQPPAFALQAPPDWRCVASESVPEAIMRGLSLPIAGQALMLFQVDDPAELPGSSE